MNRDPRFALSQELEAKQTLLDQLRALAVEDPDFLTDGPIAFSAQYQQTPIPPGGTIIKRKWLTTYDQIASRPDDRIVMSWDIALSEIESGDYSACVVLLIRKEIVHILEVVRGRFPFETLKKKVMELKRRYSPSTLLIEDSPHPACRWLTI
jgi:phage terminase large subunit-like protein